MSVFRKHFHHFVLLLVWFASVLLTWRIVENPYWDFADLLYISERLSLGLTMYRDLQNPYPPLIFWLYGLVMKAIPHSYAAVSVVSALSALLFLISNYKISRLFHSRSDSLKIAICIYLALFTVSSVTGENFIAAGFSFVGIMLFNWFAWFACKFLKDKPPDILSCLSTGVLAGLCLLSKHERALGVAGVLSFLVFVFLFWKHNRTYWARMLILLLGMLVVSGSGYGYAIIRSGWFYVSSSLTQYGGITKLGTQNIPVLVDLGVQFFLTVLHFGFIMTVAAWAILRLRDKGGADNRFAPLAARYALGAIVISVLLLALESGRVLAVARQIDLSNAKYLTRTMSTVVFNSPHGLQLVQSVVNYFGGILFGNILPMISIIILLLAGLVIRLRQPARDDSGRPGNTPWLPALSVGSAETRATGMNGKANLGEVRQMTDEDGLAQASAEFRLACATDAPRLVAGSFTPRLRQARMAFSLPSRKQLFSIMLLCAALAFQARCLARRSDIGTFALVFPVFFIYAERLPFIILNLKPKLSLWRAFKHCYLSAFLLIMFLSSFILYAYEFRGVLINPVRIQSDKGTIKLPDLPMNRAFAQLVSFMRDNKLIRWRIVAVPISGAQYWIGGKPTPFGWTAYIQSEQYHSPWSDNLKEGLGRNDCVFIEFCRQETGIQSIISAENWSWIDGPMYRLERWKDSFPLIWNHIKSNTQPVAAFGPSNDPYFRVYISTNILNH